jgi:hypothetical protein
VNELHKKYAEKGLIVTGVNIKEDGKEKVTEFVKKKGDGMSYNVAYSGKEGPFLTQWYKAFGLNGIPTTVIVKDGKLLIIVHPMQLTDEFIAGILAGGSAQEKVCSTMASANAKNEKIEFWWDAYNEADSEGDVAGITKAIDGIKELAPDHEMLPMMNFNLLMAKNDWTAAEAALTAISGEIRPRALVTTSQAFLSDEKKAPAAFMKTVAIALDHEIEAEADAMDRQMVAALYWKAGEKESALKSAKQAAELAAAAPKVAGEKSLPAAPFIHYAEAMEQGTPPTFEEFRAMIVSTKTE